MDARPPEPQASTDDGAASELALGDDRAAVLEEIDPELLKDARAYATAARAERTRDAYRYQWARFEAWCDERGFAVCPAQPTTVALYLTAWANAGGAVATLGQALAAISEAHRVAGHPSPRKAPAVREVWKGIRRQLGVAPRRVDPLVVERLRELVTPLEDSRIARRDRALLTVGFAGAFRRSELVALDVENLRFTDDGVEILIRRSKTDQDGAGVVVGIPFGSDPATCPVRSTRAWLEDAMHGQDALFRSVSRHGKLGNRLAGRDVARIIKRRALAAGLDPADFSGHSLRSGLATSAAKAGKNDRAIMRQGRWRSRGMVDRYVRDAKLLDDDNAASGIGSATPPSPRRLAMTATRMLPSRRLSPWAVGLRHFGAYYARPSGSPGYASSVPLPRRLQAWLPGGGQPYPDGIRTRWPAHQSFRSSSVDSPL